MLRRALCLTLLVSGVAAAPGEAAARAPGALRAGAGQADIDLTARPAFAEGGVIASSAGTLRRRRGQIFAIPAGATIPAGAARDRYGNSNG